MKLRLFACVIAAAMAGSFTTSGYAQQPIGDFAEANTTMEGIVFRKEAVNRGDLEPLDRVLEFVSDKLPPQSLEQSTRSLQSSGARTGSWECRRCYYRDRCGRLCYRYVRVRVCPPPEKKKYGESKSLSILADRVLALQDAVENFSNNPGAISEESLRDLARQVYAVTLSADDAFTAGSIKR